MPSKKPASTQIKVSAARAARHQQCVLAWYDQNARSLPWRRDEGMANPYHVWLSEIMLQQTTVGAVKAYFDRFTKRWPEVCALAAASLDDVLREWAGLGYYARARNLHKCALYICEELGGRFPKDEKALLDLPGVGPYTAAAISSIAFSQPAVVVDGNVERVMARLFKVATPLPAAKTQLSSLAGALSPSIHQSIHPSLRPGDYAQAMMDLGATICTPNSPKCDDCPIAGDCMAKGAEAAEYPKRAPKKMRPKKSGIVYWAQNQGAVLVRRRPARGLLGGLLEFPSSPWKVEGHNHPLGDHAPIDAQWSLTGQSIKHVFTHFELELFIARADTTRTNEGMWIAIEDVEGEALPTLMKKVARTCRATTGD